MIEELTVRNVGGIAHVALLLQSGLTAVTGESGTGKSSLVRALELLGGKRGQSALIRAGEEEASVEAVLSGMEKAMTSVPDAADFIGEDPMLYVRRTLSRNGRNRTLLQGRSVPFSQYAQVMNDGLRIQSQFAQMELLDPKRQLDILDFCGGQETGQLLKALAETFREAVECGKSLRATQAKGDDLRRRFQESDALLSAADGIRLFPGCDLAWEREHADLGRTIERTRSIQQFLLRFTGGLSGEGILDAVEQSGVAVLREIPEAGEELQKLFNDGLDALQRFVRDVERRIPGVQTLEALEKEHDTLERRIGTLRRLKRATNSSSLDGLMAWCDEARHASEWLREEELRSSELTGRGRALRKEASRLAMELRATRTASASALEKRVNSHLKDLAMEDSLFRVRLSPLDRIRSFGADDVLFTLSVGGREETPVNRTASGGELSRLLLAIQLALPDALLPPVLVFDEVEAGLGGMAAVLAGYKLLELSRRCQVLLVTHEATIAALAQHHFAVRKEGEQVTVERLSPDDRVEEVARMLSGNSTLTEAREHARKLLETPPPPH